VAQFHRDVDHAAGLGCELAVFPEQFITGYRAESDPAWLRAEFAAASERQGEVLLCCGTISEEGQNRQYWYRGGETLACYSKVHLFKPNGEHELWRPGSAYQSLVYFGRRIGLGTCNDVRFPEQMADLSRAGKLHLLVYPALWPAVRDHIWAALLRARAIEHGAFCLGCCVKDVDNGKETFSGADNHVFGPTGEELAGENGVYELDTKLTEELLVNTQAEYMPATAGPVTVVPGWSGHRGFEVESPP
jgi:omega-amidase